MPEPRPLAAATAAEALVTDLRGRILDRELAPGERLIERDLVETYDVARHTVRMALRMLASEGLVTIERNRGAHVAELDATSLEDAFELRTALELESAHRMLERHDGRVAPLVHAAMARLESLGSRRGSAWRNFVDAHDALHTAIVTAGDSARISSAYAQLTTELNLFVIALKPLWTLDRMVEHHRRLLVELEAEGPPALRRHLEDGAAAVLDSLAGDGQATAASL